MIKKIARIIAGLSLLLLPVLYVATTHADASHDSVCQGIGLASGAGGCIEDPSAPGVSSTIHTVVTILSFLVGAASIVMIIIGGFRYITSGGDSAKVGNAKNTILYALVGLIVVALAQVIVQFTINKTSTTPPPTHPSPACSGACSGAH